MGRFLILLLATLVTTSTLATERVAVDPFVKAGPGYSATNGSLTGYIPTKSNTDLLLEAERKGWLPPSGTGPKTALPIKATVKVPVAGIAGKVKSLIRGTPGNLLLNGAIATALAGVGWVIDNGSVVEKKQSVGGLPAQLGDAAGLSDLCLLPAAKTVGKITVIKDPRGVTWAGWVGYMSQKPSGYDQFANNCTRSDLGYAGSWEEFAKTQTVYPQVWGRAISIDDIKEENIPVPDADLDKLDPVISAGDPNWLKDLLKEACEGSLAPQRCFDDLQKQSPPLLTGPSSVAGPTSNTNGTYTRPDGTTGTTGSTSNTTYNIRYGDTYVDVTTNTTTTTVKDGVTDSTSNTSDEGTPQEKPDEEQDDEEKPERLASGDPCDVPLSCSGDAIDCALLTQEKALRCAYEKQSDYDKHKADIKAAVVGDKFEIDDSSEIQIPSFINQGTRFLPASCPADKTFTLRTNGGRSFAVTYEPLCAAATDLGYLIVIAVGAFCVLYVGRSLGGE